MRNRGILLHTRLRASNKKSNEQYVCYLQYTNKYVPIWWGGVVGGTTGRNCSLFFAKQPRSKPFYIQLNCMRQANMGLWGKKNIGLAKT